MEQLHGESSSEIQLENYCNVKSEVQGEFVKEVTICDASDTEQFVEKMKSNVEENEYALQDNFCDGLESNGSGNESKALKRTAELGAEKLGPCSSPKKGKIGEHTVINKKSLSQSRVTIVESDT